MRPRGFSRTGGGLASGRLSEGHGPPAPGAPGDSMPAPCCEWALGRHTAGIFLVTTLLRFSSGSCQTEEIVSSEMNVLGKFVFPGKSCFLGPHPPVPLGLAVPHAVPRAPPHAPGSVSPQWTGHPTRAALDPPRGSQHPERVPAPREGPGIPRGSRLGGGEWSQALSTLTSQADPP